MKHWLGLVLALALLLGGCAPAQETTTPTDMTQDATGLSAPADTQGSGEPEKLLVRRFQETGFYAMAYLGEKLLLARNDQGTGELWLLDPVTLETVKTVRLAEGVVPGREELQITQMGVGFYDEVNGMMLFWDENLRELARVTLPERILGKAWLSPDWKKSYFCTEEGIHVMDMQTNIEVLLKQNPGQAQQLTGVLAEGTVLRYSLKSESGEEKLYLVDASTGMRLEEGSFLASLTTWEDGYYLPMEDGPVRRLLFGTGSGQKLLWPRVEDAKVYPLLAVGGAVTETPVDIGVCLEYYDLESGRRTSSVTVKNGRVQAILPDGNGNIWCMAGNENQDALALLDLAQLSELTEEDEQIYVTPYFTPDNPDRAGLVTLQQELKTLGDKYGVNFLVWQDAAANNPWDYTFEGEYLTQVYRKYLPALEKALALFPEGFLQKVTGNETRKLTISLVRGISDIADTAGRRQISGIQYWLGDTPCIALELDEDLERSVYHQVGLLVDTQVLMRSGAYDLWSRRTPPGFAYDNDYIKNLDRTDIRFTVQGDSQYFIDLFSMSYAREDRATVFEYACAEGGGEVFSCPIIQGKLQQICLGIREAFGLKDPNIILPWEQYITK